MLNLRTLLLTALESARTSITDYVAWVFLERSPTWALTPAGSASRTSGALLVGNLGDGWTREEAVKRARTDHAEIAFSGTESPPVIQLFVTSPRHLSLYRELCSTRSAKNSRDVG